MLCQYAILNLGYKTPTEFVELPLNDKAFISACILNKIEAEKKALKRV